jgi:hypothetical protein
MWERIKSKLAIKYKHKISQLDLLIRQNKN